MPFNKGIDKLGTEGSQDKRPMVSMKILVPAAIRDEMREIWHRKGYTMSQQARLSLMLWCRMHGKDPTRVDGLFAMALSPRSVNAAVEAELDPEQREQREVLRAQQRQARREKRKHNAAFDPSYDPAKDPEPDKATQPAAWGAWDARQKDYIMHQIAQGKLPPAWLKD